jgi:GT2 family glycosyltransferase
VDISFVIINYNTKDLLKECIENLLDVQKSIPSSEIIVVDNRSTDGSYELVNSLFGDKVLIFRNDVNKLSAAHNFGYKESKGDYILHLGTDCFPKADAIKYLMEFIASNPDTGVVTAKIVLRDGSLDWDAHRGIPTPWVSLAHFLTLDKIFKGNALFDGYFLTSENFSQPHEIGTCISHFMMIPRTVYEKVGLWDTRYVLYGEDIDYCYRVKKAGYKVMYIPQIEVLHYKGAGVGRATTKDLTNASRSDKKHLKKIRNETTRAMKLFYQTHLASQYPFVVNVLVYSGISLLQFVRNIVFTLQTIGR